MLNYFTLVFLILVFCLNSNTIRETRLGALDTTSGDGEVPKILGNPNREFSFADISNNIEFIDCSSSPKSSSTEAIIKWIDTTV